MTGMSIQELFIKFKGFLQNSDFLLVLLIIIVSLASFYLGKFSVSEKMGNFEQKAQVISKNNPLVPTATVSTRDTRATSSIETQGAYVASKSGTKYHLPWCPGAQQIKDANKIWFATKEDAEKAGYAPAANCKGM